MKSNKVNINQIWEKKFKKDVGHQEFGVFLKNYLNDFLKHLSKKSKILDLGCGNGEKTNYIMKKGHNIIGIDTSKTAINYARKKFGKYFYRRSVLNTKFKEDSFDAIISIAVYHCFLEKDRKKYVKEISRILKKNGLMFQLVLSLDDETMRSKKEIEPNTFLQKSRTPFHLFSKDELKKDFLNFQFIKLRHYHKNSNGFLGCMEILMNFLHRKSGRFSSAENSFLFSSIKRNQKAK